MRRLYSTSLQQAMYMLLAFICFFVAIFSSPLLALDPKKRITQYDIRVYKAEHGLPMNDIKDVFQDSKGYLWLACQEGFVRFDGARFVLFDKSNCPGLRENFILDIEEDWEGNLWLATQGGGASRFNRKTFATFDTSDGLASTVVTRILIGKHNTIWFGTEKGVTRLKNGIFTSYKFGNVLKEQFVAAIHEDQSGDLLIGSWQYGLHVLRNDSAFTFPIGHGVTSFCERSSGEIIIGTNDGKLYSYRYGRIERYNPYQLPTDHMIRAIHEDKDGNLWFSVEGNGILRYYGERFEILNMETGLLADNNFFNKVIEDRERSLWFTGGSGLFQLKDNKFIAFGHNEGFVSNFGHTVCEDRDGNIWAGLRMGGLAKFDRYSTRTWGAELGGLGFNEITSIIPARDGGLWIGAGFDGLINLKAGLFDRVEVGLPSPFILSLFENAHGELWIGTLCFLTKFDGKNFKNYRLVDSGESGDVIAVIETANGEIWAGTRKKGLYKLSREEIYHFTPKDGITADGVNALYEDAERVLWIATDGQGLYRYKDGKFANINSRNGLYFDRLFSILEDDQHDLWLSGNRGIFRVSKQQLNDFADEKADAIICQAYNDLDGMRETECNGRRQPVAWKSQDGRLWFVSTAGVVCVDPNNMPVNKVPPPVYLEEVIVNQQRAIVPDSSFLHFEASERELEFHFTALSFVIPERVKFSYKLEGYDQNWVEAGTRRSAFYTNLPKGHYTFRVKACNNDGVWNETGAVVQLRIAPFWWETWWAYLLYVFALIGAFLVIRRYEMKRLHLRNELKLQQVHTERLEELDHLKSRFFAGISHEFRTPLTLIGGPLKDMLEKNGETQQQSQLAMMLRNTRRLERLVDELLDLSQLENGKMILQARPVRLVHFLQGLVAAFESYAKQKNIKLEFCADDQITSEIVFIDPDKMEKVVVNLVANALKYTASGGSVEVAVGSSWGSQNRPTTDVSEFVEIHLHDTGVGIPEKALPHVFDYFYRYRDKNTNRESGTGIGLALTKELVELHHGEISVTSSEGVGSEFVIRLPLGKAHLKPEEIVSDGPEEPDNVAYKLVKTATLENNGVEIQTAPMVSQSRKTANLPSVLLIEDNPDMRSYLREHLHQYYILMEAADGEDGLQQARSEIPDIIISDVMMPKMDGFELCRQLKTDELTCHIPVILLTARGSGESKLEGLELGANEYLTKPLSRRELQLRVKNLIDQQRKLQERFRKEIAAVEIKLSKLPLASMDEKFLKRATEVLEKHISNPNFGPEAFAREMAISKAHLNRKLRGLLGQRTGDFIRSMRLKRAAEMLCQKSGTVSEIAYQVGFNHLSYFARSFKAQYGQLPSEYRQKITDRSVLQV